MAESPSGGEKTELPTPKRMQTAREEGQVSFSSEVNISGLLLVGFGALAIMAPWFWQAMEATMRFALVDALNWELDDRTTQIALIRGSMPAFGWLLPLLGILFAAGVGLSVAQVGFQPTLKPLMPNLTRINPLTGLGRLFGMRGLVRFAVNLAKLTLVIGLSWWLLASEIPRMVTVDGDFLGRTAAESWLIFALVMKIAGLLGIIAAIDFLFQRWQHTRDQMMTKQELKEEFKQSEGDPLIKSKIRQIQRQMAQRRMMQEVPKADVVITNPTHVAVALKYDKGNMHAPVVVAKGYDEVAQRIKALAAKHNIVMVENISLARALAKEVEIGKAIPTKWYQAVAEVLSIVYKLKKRAA